MTDLYVTWNASKTTGSPAARVGILGGRSAGVTGFYETIMQWLKCLLTVPGTDLSDPSYGTDFATVVATHVANQQTARDVLVMSVQRATATIKKYQADQTLSAEALLQDAVVDNVLVSADGVELYVTLTNRAGTRVQLPLSS